MHVYVCVCVCARADDGVVSEMNQPLDCLAPVDQEDGLPELPTTEYDSSKDPAQQLEPSFVVHDPSSSSSSSDHLSLVSTTPLNHSTLPLSMDPPKTAGKWGGICVGMCLVNEQSGEWGDAKGRQY